MEEKIFLALPQNYRGNQNSMAVLSWYYLQMIWWIKAKGKRDIALINICFWCNNTSNKQQLSMGANLVDTQSRRFFVVEKLHFISYLFYSSWDVELFWTELNEQRAIGLVEVSKPVLIFNFSLDRLLLS